MPKKILSLTISLLLMLSLAACGEAEDPAALVGPLEDVGITTNEAEAPVNRTVVYIPLDDRPNNYECMAYRAQALGYGIVMPDPDLFRSRLNEQPANSNGTLYGDRAALYEWVLAMEERGYNYYVIFLDQLLSGGLVNSRAMQMGEPVTLSDGSTVSEEEMIENIFRVLGEDSNNRVWLLDTVMRLAPTVGYLHWDMNDYTTVREFFAQPRVDINGSLDPETVIGTYMIGEDGKPLDPSKFGCKAADIDECIAARTRKFMLSDQLLQLAAEDTTGIFRVLFGIDDSSNDRNVQTAELTYIREHLSENGYLLSGVDDMCFKALGKMFLEDVDWQGGTVDIEYIGGAENEASSIFDYDSIKAVMAEHLAFFDMTESADADLKMFVITRADDEAKRDEYVQTLIDGVNESMAAGHPTILIDDTVCTYPGFPNCLVGQIDLGRLVAYSGRLDMANIIGTAVSHGVSRYAFLLKGEETYLTDAGHMRTIADGLIKDFCYRNVLRSEMDTYVKNTLGGDFNNFYLYGTDVKKANSYAAQRMEELSAPLIEALEASSFITSLSPYAEKEWSQIRAVNYNFPWHRTFELTFNLRLEEKEQ